LAYLTPKAVFLQAGYLGFLSLENLGVCSHINYEGCEVTLMSKPNEGTKPVISTADLAHLGGGVLAYVREIEGREAAKLLGNQMQVPPNAILFCLYNADGAPISISPTLEGAVGSAIEHELIAATVH
jgi:hypothetical protein